MKFGAKLITGFMGVSLVLLGIGIIGIMSTRKIGEVVDRILYEEIPLNDAIMEAKYELVVARDLMGEYLIATDPAELQEHHGAFEDNAREMMERFVRIGENGARRTAVSRRPTEKLALEAVKPAMNGSPRQKSEEDATCITLKKNKVA